MKASNFPRYLPVYLVLVILCLLASAVSLVWLRQQVAGQAKVCVQLEQKKRILERQNHLLKAKLAYVHNAEVLQSNAHLTLHKPANGQVVWLDAKEGWSTQQFNQNAQKKQRILALYTVPKQTLRRR